MWVGLYDQILPLRSRALLQLGRRGAAAGLSQLTDPREAVEAGDGGVGRGRGVSGAFGDRRVRRSQRAFLSVHDGVAAVIGRHADAGGGGGGGGGGAAVKPVSLLYTVIPPFL